jgi:hypothetical protein
MAVLDGTFALIVALAFASVKEFVFESTAVFAFASSAGADSSVASAVVCKTEMFPVKAGIAKSKAESINVVAAIIVIFDKIVCAPRG